MQKEKLMDYLIILRPYQWTKNLLVFAGLIFSRNISNTRYLLLSIASFMFFCIVSSGIYILNDVIDKKKDVLHPKKASRPVASGRISSKTAVFYGSIFLLSGLGAAWLTGLELFIVITFYVVLHILYSFFFKHMVILDVFCIAAGFVLRAVGGAEAIGVAISPWLVLCTFFLSLFISFAKRRCELEELDEKAFSHRISLKEYSLYYLDNLTAVVTGITVLSYALYTMAHETVVKFGTDKLIYTVPFVMYGIFRYLFLIHRKQDGADPSLILLKDRPLLIDIFLWLLACVIIIYGR